MKILLLYLLIPITGLSQSHLIIRHVNVVDVRTGNIKSNQYVSIHKQKIIAIHSDNNSLKLSEKQIDGTNRFLIPGLWDMHSHNNGDINYTRNFIVPIMLTNGVTGLRDMWGMKEEIDLRDSVNQGLLVAPRMIVGTPLVNGPTTFFEGSVSIKNVEQVPVVVDSLQKIGYDFLKIYSFLRSDIFNALTAYCKKKNFSIAGHIPIGVTAEDASNAKMQSFEHLFGLRKSFSNNSRQLCKHFESEVPDTSDFATQINVLTKTESHSLSFDTAMAKRVIATLIANHTAVVPTITAIYGVSLDIDTLRKITPLTYVVPSEEKMWYDARAIINFDKGLGENSLQLLNFLYKQGVMILAGTDNENPFVLQGISIHDELQNYVKAGLNPLQALQTATINPAVFLHKENELGTVDVGKLADLVILNDNPLKNITNTKKIKAVIMNGTLIDEVQIEQMLNKLKEKAAR